MFMSENKNAYYIAKDKSVPDNLELTTEISERKKQDGQTQLAMFLKNKKLRQNREAKRMHPGNCTQCLFQHLFGNAVSSFEWLIIESSKKLAAYFSTVAVDVQLSYLLRFCLTFKWEKAKAQNKFHCPTAQTKAGVHTHNHTHTHTHNIFQLLIPGGQKGNEAAEAESSAHMRCGTTGRGSTIVPQHHPQVQLFFIK